MDGSRYEGEFRNDFEHGKGIKHFSDHEKFHRMEGWFERGSLQDKHGKILMKNGSVFQGEVQHGKITGKGEIVYKNDPKKRTKYQGY